MRESKTDNMSPMSNPYTYRINNEPMTVTPFVEEIIYFMEQEGVTCVFTKTKQACNIATNSILSRSTCLIL
jgi:hypothetical protein